MEDTGRQRCVCHQQVWGEMGNVLHITGWKIHVIGMSEDPREQCVSLLCLDIMG